MLPVANPADMSRSVSRETTIQYFRHHESVGVWSALVAFVAVIGGGSSLSAKSSALTFCFLLGVAAVWWLGYWALSKSCYFISTTGAGFRDLFRAREVRFDEVRSVTRRTRRYSSTLIFQCATRTVEVPWDPLDETWFSAVEAELTRRGIPVLFEAFGFPVKRE